MSPAKIMREYATRDSVRILAIREILISSVFSDKCKLFEIKCIINKARMDYEETIKKIDPDFNPHIAVAKLLLKEEF